MSERVSTGSLRGGVVLLRLLTLLAVPAAAAVLLATPAAAEQQLEVTTEADTAVCDADECGLRGAIAEAEAEDDRPATITLPAGDYALARDGLRVESEITIVGDGAQDTIIEATGVRPFLVRVSGDLTLEGLAITGGQADDGDGGAVRADTGGTVELREVHLDDNEAQRGGALAVDRAEARVVDSALTNNEAQQGGAVHVDGDTPRLPTDVALVNTTISGNDAPQGGGGLAVAATQGEVALTHVTLADNGGGRAPGPAVQSLDAVNAEDAEVTAQATLIADNRADSDAVSDCDAPLGSRGGNLSEGVDCFEDEDEQVQVGSDLGIASLAVRAPGATPTHALSADSPAVDAVDACERDADQRGVARPQDGSGDGTAACDVGAYERAEGARLAVDKDAPSAVSLGETFDYTITVRNPTEQEVGPLEVTDEVPAAVAVEDVEGDGVSCDEQDGAISCERATSLGAGEDVTVTVTVTAQAATSSANNTAVAETVRGDLSASDSASVLILDGNPCPPSDFPDRLERLAGDDRFETAVEVARACFDEDASAAVLTRADIFPDALSGTALAVAEDAPMLFSDSEALTPSTAQELQSLLDAGDEVYLLGGTAALSDDVEARVEELGFEPVRLGGANRFETATVIAEEGLDDPGTVLLSTGQDFPDPLAGAAGEAADGAVLLTDGEQVPDATQDYLDGRVDDPTLYAIGGPAAQAMPSAQPVVGSDRFATSVEVAEEFFASPSSVGIATGGGFADALSGGVHMGRQGGPMLLTRTASLPDDVEDYLTERADELDQVWVFGGTGVVSDEVAEAAEAIVYEVGP